MKLGFVSGPDGGLLSSIRETLAFGDEVLACVAFATEAGVHLVRRELTRREDHARLIVTSALSTTEAALAVASDSRCDVRIHNPGRSTYHPKVFLARAGDDGAAVIGSANLTNGLAVNIEAAIAFQGPASTPLFANAWNWAEALWTHRTTCPWERSYEAPEVEPLHPDIRRHVRAAIRKDATFLTLREQRPNFVTEVTDATLYVKTERSASLGRPPQPVPAWMVNLAWERLRARGVLTNEELLNELRVHRSSFVLALLARLPGVEPLSGRRMGVRLTESNDEPAP